MWSTAEVFEILPKVNYRPWSYGSWDLAVDLEGGSFLF
jgi:hypothetical protein